MGSLKKGTKIFQLKRFSSSRVLLWEKLERAKRGDRVSKK